MSAPGSTLSNIEIYVLSMRAKQSVAVLNVDLYLGFTAL